MALPRTWPRRLRWKVKAKVMLFVTRNFIVDRTRGTLELLRQDGITGPKAWARVFWFAWARPGMLRVAKGGASVALEIWALPAEGFGRFVAAIPAPLSIGTLTLADGRTVKGFLAESDGVDGARDISSFGGWRAFVAAAE